jgi:uncharacterized protein
MPSLSDRLKSLGVRTGAEHLPQPRPKRANPIEKVVPGRYHTTQGGETYLVDQYFSADHRYGKAPIGIRSSLQTLAQWAAGGSAELYEKIHSCSTNSFAFLDIETTGLVGGTGVYPFLVGIGRFEEGGFHLAQFFMSDPASEPAHLLAIDEFLAPCETLVTYNGKSFDGPMLTTRFITQGWKSPLLEPAHLDLLHLARRVWRERLQSKTLGSVETLILGAQRTEDDVPGWMIPQLYFDYLHTGDAAPLKSVFYHNAMDVLALAAMLNHVNDLLESALDLQPIEPLELLGVARLYEDLGRVEEACQAYHTCLEASLPAEQFWDALQRLSFLHKRRDEYKEAVDYWKIAAGGKQLYAFVELAKYYEHQLKNYSEALHWTQSALEHVTSSSLPTMSRLEWQHELEHRRARLLRKSAGLDLEQSS